MQNKQKYTAIGVMSGTSLDGLDLALCHFYGANDDWFFEVEKYETVSYTKVWRQRLSHAQLLSGYDLVRLHREYGQFIGENVLRFSAGIKSIDFVASHGHTVFHEPGSNISLQVGDGAAIASVAQIQTITDFRTLDINLGGQGAPLVPIGDKLLFADYDSCVNLGGFANLSFDKNAKRIAYDICPVNMVINDWVNEYYNVDFDKDGLIGANGAVIPQLLYQLNGLDFYGKAAPKSLGREWVETTFNAVVKEFTQFSSNDVLTTLYHHIAATIAVVLNENHLSRILFTGGGVYNQYLMKLIVEKTVGKIEIPSKELIESKEALIFAFLGLLRRLNINNCLCSVTGARQDNCGGVIHEIKNHVSLF